MFDQEELGPEQRRIRDEQAVKLFTHLFHKTFCPSAQIPVEKKGSVLPVYFCGWLDRNMCSLEFEEECAKAGVEVEIWYYVREIVDRGTAPEVLTPLWYLITLAERPEPVQDIKSINMVINTTYMDNTISVSQAFVSREMFPDQNKITDSLFATVLRNNFFAVLEAILIQGIDGLHEQAKKNVFTSVEPEDPFEVLMGLMLKHLIPMVKPALRAPVTSYLRLAQQCIRPPVPAQLLAQFEAKRKQVEALQAGKPRGGWDA